MVKSAVKSLPGGNNMRHKVTDKIFYIFITFAALYFLAHIIVAIVRGVL